MTSLREGALVRLALLGIAGCSAGSPASSPTPSSPVPAPTASASSPAPPADLKPPPFAAPSSPWADLGPLALDADGETTEIVLPWAPGQGGFALQVFTGPFRCVQISELADADGQVYVGPADYGPYCTRCDQRVAVVGGAGAFVLPSGAAPFAPASPLRVRFGLRDCDTLGSPKDPASPATLTARVRPLGPLPARGTVALRVLVTPASAFYPDARTSDLEAALFAVNDELSSAALAVTADAIVRAPVGAASDARFSLGAPDPLAALVPPGFGATTALTVVLAGCLQLDDPIRGGASEVQGYTPHIPGGAGPADAVFIKGALCGTPSLVQVAYAPTALARVLAHEIGHYLGLYHSVEADGTADTLPDTGADNLMFYKPSVAGATGLSPDQGTIVRRHPLVSLAGVASSAASQP